MGNTQRRFGFVLSIAAILLLAGVPAGAEILFDSFGSGDSYDINSGWTIGGNWSTGAQFSFAGPPSYYLDRIDVAAGLFAGGNELYLALRTDASGAPGTVLESFAVTDAMGEFSVNNPPVEITSVARPVLTPGTPYWLVLSAPSDTWASWNVSSPPVFGTFAQRYQAYPWSFHESNEMPAFRIHGEPVPLPGAALLGILGLGSAGWRLRRRRA